jgi:hypothetical protein
VHRGFHRPLQLVDPLASDADGGADLPLRQPEGPQSGDPPASLLRQLRRPISPTGHPWPAAGPTRFLSGSAPRSLPPEEILVSEAVGGTAANYRRPVLCGPVPPCFTEFRAYSRAYTCARPSCLQKQVQEAGDLRICIRMPTAP